MIYLSAQPDESYYHWQLDVLIDNFTSLGIPSSKIHILFSYDPARGVSAECLAFMSHNNGRARFFVYSDTRKGKGYPPSVRPHIIAKHCRQYPYLFNEEPVFYHDPDIVFTDKLPDWDRLTEDGSWYISDTRSYIGPDRILSCGSKLLDDMCEVLHIDREIVIAGAGNAGGAQYVLKGIDATFWEEAETDCENLFSHLEKNRGGCATICAGK